MKLTDTHCHVSEPEFDKDRDEVFARARAAGVARLIVIGGTAEMNQRAGDLASSRKEVYWTAGLDPAGIVGKSPAELGFLSPPSAPPEKGREKLVAIGEIGLDEHHRYTPLSHQRDMFRAQLELAKSEGLPVVIHSRETGAPMLEAYAASGRPGGVWHSFVGSREEAFKALDLGLYISFSGMLTFKNAPGLREIAPLIPEGRVLVETDSPYLAPIPHRGRRCEPAFVADTARVLAGLRSKPLEELAPILEDNVVHCFPRMERT